MDASSANRVRVVGCGRWLRRDDQVGLLVVEALQTLGCLPAGTALTEAPGAELADVLEGCEALILVDAAAPGTGRPPGTWQRIDYRAAPHRLRTRSSENTHTLGVDAALRLADGLGMLPERVSIYAIAVADTEPGDAMTPDVAAAVPHVAAAILEETCSLTQTTCREIEHA